MSKNGVATRKASSRDRASPPATAALARPGKPACHCCACAAAAAVACAAAAAVACAATVEPARRRAMASSSSGAWPGAPVAVVADFGAPGTVSNQAAQEAAQKLQDDMEHAFLDLVRQTPHTGGWDAACTVVCLAGAYCPRLFAAVSEARRFEWPFLAEKVELMPGLINCTTLKFRWTALMQASWATPLPLKNMLLRALLVCLLGRGKYNNYPRGGIRPRQRRPSGTSSPRKRTRGCDRATR